jgi:hypothetical protein
VNFKNYIAEVVLDDVENYIDGRLCVNAETIFNAGVVAQEYGLHKSYENADKWDFKEAEKVFSAIQSYEKAYVAGEVFGSQDYYELVESVLDGDS